MFKDGDGYAYYDSLSRYRAQLHHHRFGMLIVSLNARHKITNCVFLVTRLSWLIYAKDAKQIGRNTYV